MKVCIAYESKYGNGKKCAEQLQSIIREKGHEVEISSVRDMKPKSLPQASLYIFSTPTHIGSPPGKMKKFLKKMEIEEEAKFALMTTCLDPQTKALQVMEEILQATGMTKISDGLKLKVTGLKGPLEEGYEQKLREFAEEILDEE